MNTKKWDLSNVSELISITNMNEAQIKFCIDNNLLEDYPLIVGKAAIIEGNIKDFFKKLK